MKRILITALVAGVCAGLAAFAMQTIRLTPLILHAETYEEVAQAPLSAHDAHAHEHDEDAWAPENGFERHAYTAATSIAVGIGFALMLSGVFALRGGPVDLRRGLMWGAAGYAAFALAPGMGLPPELPGMLSDSLYIRQAWWLGAASCTVAALALLAFGRSNALRALGLALAALPHAVGAPHLTGLGGSVPAALSAEFAASSLAAAALFWLVLGGVSGWLYGRLHATA